MKGKLIKGVDNRLVGAILILFVIIFGFACFFTGFYFFELMSPSKSIHLVNARVTRTIPLVAINSRGQGTVSELTIEIGVGEGRALVNINDVLAGYDTQRSAKYAMAVASDYLMEDLSYTDVIFSIDSSAELVSGPSAGAAMTAALIATLKNAELRDDVMLTGMIYGDGGIGPVGGVLTKAEAAKAHGATLFLVPGGQSEDCLLEQVCEVDGNLETCELACLGDYRNVSEYAGIRVVEVWTISDVIKYLLE